MKPSLCRQIAQSARLRINRQVRLHIDIVDGILNLADCAICLHNDGFIYGTIYLFQIVVLSFNPQRFRRSLSPESGTQHEQR